MMPNFRQWLSIKESFLAPPNPNEIKPSDTKYGRYHLASLGGIRDLRNEICARFGVATYVDLAQKRYIMDDGSHGMIVKPNERTIYLTMVDPTGKFSQKSIEYKRAIMSGMRPLE